MESKEPTFIQARAISDIANGGWIAAGLLALISLFPLLTAYRYPVFLNDDSYITFTYVKNLAAGNGFVFNHPPPVLGTTTPLLTLLLAGLARLLPQVEIPTLAVYISALCWLGIGWLFFFFRRAWGLAPWQASVVGLVVIASGWVGFLGMEAYLFAFLLIFTCSLFLQSRAGWAGFTTSLLFLARGEGVLVLGVLGAALIIQCWLPRKTLDGRFARQAFRKMLRLVAGFAPLTLLWGVYAQWTFGSVLPNTLAAKRAGGQSGLGVAFLPRLIEEWMPAWGARFHWDVLPFVNVWWLLVLLGVLAILRHRRQWLLLLAWIVLYTAGYAALNVSAFWWYQLPILFVLNLCFALGVITLVDALLRCAARGIDSAGNNREGRWLAWGLAGLAIALLIFVQARPTVRALATYQGDERGPSYMALSQWFREHAEPEQSIAYIEIGYLGYYTENRIIDLGGLVLPEAVAPMAAGDLAWGFWRYQPEFYIHSPDFDGALGSIRADPRFAERYEAIATLPGPRQTSLTIYARREAGASQSP